MSSGGDPFPAVNATRELNLGVPEEFPVDPISSDVEAAKLKEENAARKESMEEDDEDGCKCPLSSGMRSTFAVVVVLAAAIGIAFMVNKKMIKFT